MKPRTVIAIGCHPDDIEHGCGQYLGHLISRGFSGDEDKGVQVTYLVLTDGSLGGNPEIRKTEQQHVIDHLAKQWPEVVLHQSSFSFLDGSLTPDARLIKVLEEACKGKDLVLVQWPDDTHQDHRALGTAIKAACRYSPNVLFYQSYSTLNWNPTIFYKFRAEEMGSLTGKLTQLNFHESQILNYAAHKFPMGFAVETFARQNGHICKSPTGYAEGFIPLVYSL